MLIDSKRLEDFLNEHICYTDNNAKNPDDILIYINHRTNKYASVMEHLKIDIEVENAFYELKKAENTLFIKDTEDNFILTKPYTFRVNFKDYDYEPGTDIKDILIDMCNLYSYGTALKYSLDKYKDNMNYYFVQLAFYSH